MQRRRLQFPGPGDHLLSHQEGVGRALPRFLAGFLRGAGLPLEVEG